MSQFNRILQQVVEARLARINRRTLLQTTAVAGGTLAFGAIGVTVAQDATPETGDGTTLEEIEFENEIDVLNFALTLEHMEAAFYRDGLAEIGDSGITDLGFRSSVVENLYAISNHEASHVNLLTQAIIDLGGEPVEEAQYDFGFTDGASFLKTAQALEDTGVSAYAGAAEFLKDNDDLLTTAFTIHAVEARHATYIALLNETNPFPEAVNPSLTPAEVIAIADEFIDTNPATPEAEIEEG